MWKLVLIGLMINAVMCFEKQYWDNLQDFEVVKSLELVLSKKRSAEGVHILKLHKSNGTVMVECIKDSPFSVDSRIILGTGNSSKYIPVPSKTFKYINDNYRFRFMAHEDGTIEGILFVDDEMLVIEPAKKHIEYMAARHLQKLGSGTHVILRQESLNHEESIGCGVCNERIRSNRHLHKRARRSYPMGDKVPLVPPPDDCPSSLRVLSIVAVVDESLYDDRGVDGSVDYVTNNIHGVNAIYNEELNVKLVVSELLIMEERDDYSAEWTCSSRGQILDKLNTWINGRYSYDKVDPQPTLVLLYHDCSSGNTLGSAKVNNLCSQVNFGAEVTQRSDTRKRVILTAHEIGHLMDMEHDPDNSGIMKSSIPTNNLNKWLKFSRNSQAEGCDKLSRVGFCLTYTNTEKVYTMRKENALGYALTAQKQPNENNNNVYLYKYNDENENQHWVETKHEKYFMYRKRYTNYCLDGGNGAVNSQNLKLYECDQENVNQHWERSLVSGKAFTYRLKKRDLRYSIDGNNGGSNNQNVYLYTYGTNNHNQQWTFEKPPTA